MDQAKYIFAEVKSFFIERGTVFETGISLCSSIALNIGKNSIEILEDYGNFLYVGLGAWNQEGICKSSIMSVSDLIRSLGTEFSPYIDQILPIVFNIIQNPQCDKQLRTRCLMIFSDLYLCCGDIAINYLE